MKLKNVVRKAGTKVLLASAVVSQAMMPVVCHASFSSYSGTSGTKIVEGFKSFIGTIGTWGGGLYAASAILALILSVRNEDTEGRNKAILNLVAAIGLLSTGVIINLFF